MKKVVSFKEKEKDLVKWVEEKDFSYYVKGLIRKDMEDKSKKNESTQKRKNIILGI